MHRLDSELVGFALRLTAEARKCAAGDDLCRDLLNRSRILSQNETGENAQAVLTGDLLRRVTRHHMADLVSHDAGELGGVLGARNQAGVNVDVSSRDREGVDRRIFDDMKLRMEAD
jgi:hypothetical protein